MLHKLLYTSLRGETTSFSDWIGYLLVPCFFQNRVFLSSVVPANFFVNCLDWSVNLSVRPPPCWMCGLDYREGCSAIAVVVIVCSTQGCYNFRSCCYLHVISAVRVIIIIARSGHPVSQLLLMLSFVVGRTGPAQYEHVPPGAAFWIVRRNYESVLEILEQHMRPRSNSNIKLFPMLSGHIFFLFMRSHGHISMLHNIYSFWH